MRKLTCVEAKGVTVRRRRHRSSFRAAFETSLALSDPTGARVVTIGSSSSPSDPLRVRDRDPFGRGWNPGRRRVSGSRRPPSSRSKRRTRDWIAHDDRDPRDPTPRGTTIEGISGANRREGVHRVPTTLVGALPHQEGSFEARHEAPVRRQEGCER